MDNTFNQYYQVNSASFAYDANGNQTANPLRGQCLAWDAFGHRSG